ncbi:MAG: HemK/PrmC family methyltransferase [candidate division WOR-3 bacterium]
MKEVIKNLSKDFGLNIEETELLASTLLNKPRFELYFNQEENLMLERYLRLKFNLLKNGVPIEYVTKQVQFLDFKLALFPGVFIPRLETEYFVELIRKLIQFKPQRICEIGTGCGAISVALAEMFTDSEIIATDICKVALKNAQYNVHKFNLTDRITLINTDLFLAFKNKIFDLLVCNPPYVPRERINELPKSVRDFEPRMAIDGGWGGVVFIKKLINHAFNYLKDPITFALEIDEDEVEDLNLYLKEYTENYFFIKDLFGRTRYLFVGRFRR